MVDPIKVYPPKPAKVYFYGTCLVDMFYPDAGMAGVQLLEREGIEVIYPPDQTCCGPGPAPGAPQGLSQVAETLTIPLLFGLAAGQYKKNY